MVTGTQRSRGGLGRALGRSLGLGLGLWVGLCLWFAAAVASAAGPPLIKAVDRRFDHDRHAQVSGAAGKPAACASCHTLDASGAPAAGREHPRCAQCHTYPRSCDLMKQAGPKGQARVCQVCHKPTSNRCLPPDLPPLPTGDSFQARFTHGKHLALGTSIEKDCAQCHAAQGPAAAAKPSAASAHKLCAGCHNPNGARPTLAECQACHQAPVARAAPPADPYRLAGFDHRAHHTASGQASCLGCHDKLVGTGEGALPRPSMAACQGKCHDGLKTFAAVGTQCTACHKARDPVVPVRQDAAFSHAAHARRNVEIQRCAQCHALEADGRLTAPLAKKDHMPCAESGCHQTEYMSRNTKICGICHEAASPWQKAAARAKPSAAPDWTGRMDHAAHLTRLGTSAAAGNAACTGCHGDRLAGAAAPSGHDPCVACHGPGQKLTMTQCEGCHVAPAGAGAGAVAGAGAGAKAGVGAAARSVWSVRATFGHQQHATDPRTRGAAKCVECHKQVAASKDLASIRAPQMADCEGCHDGKTAFKTTGFQCSRCHTSPGGKPADVSRRAGARGEGLALREVAP